MICISPKKITKYLSLVVLCLILAHLAGQFSKFFLGHDSLLGLVNAFDLGEEKNIPTWYASSTLLVCSILLATIAHAKKTESDPYTIYWSALSLIFLCLSLDEAIMIHEGWVLPLRVMFNAKGFLYYTWVIPGAAFALIFFLAYLRFLAALPPRTRYLFLTAGIIYGGGVLGMEVIGARYDYLHGMGNMAYAMIRTAEESLEMLGILVFIHALLSYMKSQKIQVLFDDKEPTSRTD